MKKLNLLNVSLLLMLLTCAFRCEDSENDTVNVTWSLHNESDKKFAVLLFEHFYLDPYGVNTINPKPSCLQEFRLHDVNVYEESADSVLDCFPYRCIVLLDQYGNIVYREHASSKTPFFFCEDNWRVTVKETELPSRSDIVQINDYHIYFTDEVFKAYKDTALYLPAPPSLTSAVKAVE